MLLLPTAALCALSFPGPGVEPPAPPKPIPGVVYGRVNRGGSAGPLERFQRHLSDAAMGALLRAVPKLADFIGPATLKWVTWDRKLSALIALREGDDRDFKLALHQIAEIRDEAKDQYESAGKTAAKLHRELIRFPVANPDYTRSLQGKILSYRGTEATWRVIHDAKVRELALLEKLGQAVIGVREAERRAAPR